MSNYNHPCKDHIFYQHEWKYIKKLKQHTSLKSMIDEHYLDLYELVLDQSLQVCRFLGIYNSILDDYYYILEDHCGKIHLESCVGAIYPLPRDNAFYKDTKLNFDRVFDLNVKSQNFNNIKNHLGNYKYYNRVKMRCLLYDWKFPIIVDYQKDPWKKRTKKELKLSESIAFKYANEYYEKEFGQKIK